MCKIRVYVRGAKNARAHGHGGIGYMYSHSMASIGLARRSGTRYIEPWWRAFTHGLFGNRAGPVKGNDFLDLVSEPAGC